jgi:hypothetical protein
MAATHTSLFDMDRSLRPLRGSITWRVSYGIDNLSMEFGMPSLRVVHEPVLNPTTVSGAKEISAKVIRRNLNRRRVSVTGRWSLWIYFAHWCITRSGSRLASQSSSSRKMRPALRDLQGQRLLRVDVCSGTGETRFEFDLDTVLDVRRIKCKSKDELWLLYGVDGYERAVRGDGTFSRKKCRGRKEGQSN